MSLPAGVQTVVVQCGPYPSSIGTLSIGYVEFLATRDVVHGPSHTTIVAFRVQVPLGSSVPVSSPPLLASDADGLVDLPPGGLAYWVTVALRDPNTLAARTLGPRSVLLLAATPIIDLDDLTPALPVDIGYGYAPTYGVTY